MKADSDPHRFGAWRSMLAQMSSADSKLAAFRDAVNDIARQVAAGRFTKSTGVDELVDQAAVCGLTEDIGREEVERIIGEAFRHDFATSLSYVDIAYDPIPPRDWLVRDRLPTRNVALMSGEGAIGKSILLLQLSAATVLGKDWIGTLPEQGPVIFLSCEDDDDEIRRRLQAIAEHYGVTRGELQALHVLSLVGKDAVLAIADGSGRMIPTPLFDQLREAAISIKPRLIVLDTVADVFAGNENDRSQTRQFISLMRGLAIDSKGTVVMSSHPSLTGKSSDTGLSGSTAWHNSVRARLYLKAAPEVDDPDLRILEMRKSNYGPIMESILLRWRNGLYLPEARAGSFEQMAADAKVDNLFLDLLRRFARQGRNVSAIEVQRTHPLPLPISRRPRKARSKRRLSPKRWSGCSPRARSRSRGKVRPPANASALWRSEHVPTLLPTGLATACQRLPTACPHTPPIPPCVLEGRKGALEAPPPFQHGKQGKELPVEQRTAVVWHLNAAAAELEAKWN